MTQTRVDQIFEGLDELWAAHREKRIEALFDQDPARFENFSRSSDGLLLDFSKTSIDPPVLAQLIALAKAASWQTRRDAMFSGEKINETENRAVLHTALRAGPKAVIALDGKDVMMGVRQTLARMKEFSTGIRDGQITGSSGARFTDIVNIGIGGSDLGPAMASRALAPYHDGPNTHFISNVDAADVSDTLKRLDPKTTLVIIASKTFSTIETMMNAQTVRDWLLREIPQEKSGDHLVALSSNLKATAEFGIDPSRVFGFEDWVGGRYSLWGPIGLSIMLAIGPSRFEDFLNGARLMDDHTKAARAEENLPLVLALLGIWHRNICGYKTRAVLPYDQRLSRLPAYLQQLDMESNGKSVALDGSALARASGPIVWGEPGTNGQHAFYQLLHQGSDVIPAEFLLACRGHEPSLAHQHRLLSANCLAQSEALMRGRSIDEARARMAQAGWEGEARERQAQHRVFPGNRPSITILYDQLTPLRLGQILALYEHRVFYEGVIWGINSFDQWGVELGKELALRLEPLFETDDAPLSLDGSTRGLLDFLKEGQGK